MRIAFLSFEYQGERLVFIGGEATYAKEICTSLVKLGHEVSVFCASAQRKRPYEDEEGTTIFPIYCPRPLPYLRFMLAMRKLTATKANFLRSFDVIHTNGLGSSLCGKMPIPIVNTAHHLYAAEADGEPLWKRLSHPSAEISPLIIALQRRSINQATHIIAVSNFTKRCIMRYANVLPADISVIYHGADHLLSRPMEKPDMESRREIGLNEDEFLLLFVGQYANDRKGLSYLLRSLKLIWQKIPNVRLVICGEGDVPRYQALAIRLGIADSVSFAGHVSQQKLSKLYMASDLFVLPTLFEGLGIVFLEAMSFGLPIVASNVGPIPEIVKQGKNGLLVEPENSLKLAQAIEVLLMNSNIRLNIRQENARSFQRFTWAKAAYKTERLYEKLVRERVCND